MLSHYVGTVEVEAMSLVDMINQNIIPSVKAAGVGPLSELEAAVKTIKNAMSDIHHTEDEKEKANKARTLRLETMLDIRGVCDAAEAVVPEELWSIATYKELLFLDQTNP
jgi:glutamine synthetase